MNILVWVMLFCIYFVVGRPAKVQQKQRLTAQNECLGSHSRSTLKLARIGNRDYFVSTNQLATWFAAMQFCRLYGMELATVRTAMENILIHNHLASLGLSDTRMFISGHKIGRDNYAWADGSNLTFNDWAPGQPSKNTENCLVMWKKDWYHLPCDYASNFICEQL